MKTLLLVMLILTACGGNEKKETSSVQLDMQATDLTLIDMLVSDMILSSVDMDKEGDMVVESDSSILSDMSSVDMSIDAQVVDMSVSSDMASK